MLETFKILIDYLKNPKLEKDTNKSLRYRFLIFYRLFIFCLFTGILLSFLFGFLEQLGLLDMNSHKLESAFKKLGSYKIILLGTIVAPILEELIFRAPLVLFTSKKSFKIAFYNLSIIFGFVHLSNYEITPKILLISPILVLPQIILGAYLGFIRIRFGLQWSILLHACYNGFLMLISFTGKN